TTDAAEWRTRTGVRTDDGQSLLDHLMPLILLALFILIFRSMTRHARGSPKTWGSRGGRTIFIPYGGSAWGGSPGSSWGGGSSDGGFSGGGFSGGGGSSGGGGASGSW